VPGKLTDVTDATFQSDVLDAEGPVLVDFWAPWCGPCRAIAPILNDLAKEREETVKVVKINVDEEQVNAAKLGIMTIPTLVLFKDGQPVDRLLGGYPKRAIVERVEKHLSAPVAS
jgi:thioredoxin 1